MKKYIIIVRYKEMDIVRMVIGAISRLWAEMVANNLMVDLWRNQQDYQFRDFSFSAEEIKSNADVA